ncbi:hypothetical protein M422DRAFT_45291 [Sphaerobolus stellatus SS14]|nr:hypothetical protein M422DRAFT_45291 [Sphaerobolus stellatus SS14]
MTSTAQSVKPEHVGETEDYALSRAAEMMVKKQWELEEYRVFSQHYIMNLVNEIEIEQDVLCWLLEATIPKQKQCKLDGHGQFDGPQEGELYKLVYDLDDMYKKKQI